MIKVLAIFTLLFLTLNARENPFFPSEGEKDIILTTNEDSSKAPLKKATISIPNQARILQKVTIEYKNLDGSIERKSIDLDNSIDWHLPIFISQNNVQVQNETKKEDDNKSIVELKIDDNKSKVEPKVDKKPEIKAEVKSNVKAEVKTEAKVEARVLKKPEIKIAQPIKPKPQECGQVTLEYLSMVVSGKTLKLSTKHEAIRNFLIADPHRIVIDFKSDAEVKNYIKKDIDSIFKEIRVGNHDTFYRVVVELDGHYKYSFKKIPDGYFIELK